MARVNRPLRGGQVGFVETNHEGTPVRTMTPEQQLRRTVMSCLLWEDGFYEDGVTIAERIKALVPLVAPERVAVLAYQARMDMHLRHAPLLLVREMARHASHKPFVRATLSNVIQRADELTEFLAIYWKDGRVPLAKSVQRGLADAFAKFNTYQLAKYDRDGAVKLRDVLRLSHANPRGDGTPIAAPPTKHSGGGRRLRHPDGRGALYTQVDSRTLPTPDTWEVALSSGANKLEAWTRLLTERKLGALALLRNLRNMKTAGVSDSLVRAALRDMEPDKVLPFRFLAALRYAPQFAGELESAMLRNLEGSVKLPGTTAILVDTSPSMAAKLSAKSDMTRENAATGLAILAREICQSARIFAFSDEVAEVPAFRGLALVEKIQRAVPSSGTMLGRAVATLNADRGWDRLIVITDEESQDRVGGPRTNGYMLNVCTSKNGVGYGPWTRVDGWSDRVLDYIREIEQ